MKFARVSNVLTPEECGRIENDLDKLDRLWLNRSTCRPIVPFWTFGAVTYLEGCDDIKKYHKHKEAINPFLKKKFGWMYKILCDRMEQELGAPCVVDDMLALPGFHIFGPKKGQPVTDREMRLLEQPLASIHCDIQYKEHGGYWKCFKQVDFSNPLSFTLSVKLPHNGGGLFIWDHVDFDDDMINSFNFQTNEDKSKYLAGIKNNPHMWENDSADGYQPDGEPLIEKYTEGNLIYFLGHLLHQIIPGRDVIPTDRRITVQGHGLKCDGVWRLYF